MPKEPKRAKDGVVVTVRPGKPKKFRIKVHATVEAQIIFDKKKHPSVLLTGIEFDGFGDRKPA
jgi:hypothetical protein